MDTTILRFRGLRLRDCDAGSMTRQPSHSGSEVEGVFHVLGFRLVKFRVSRIVC